MDKTTVRCRILIYTLALAIFIVSGSVYGKEDKINPKETGVYVKTSKDLKRLLPNVVFKDNNNGAFYVESNNPAHFFLKDIEYFVFFISHADP